MKLGLLMDRAIYEIMHMNYHCVEIQNTQYVLGMLF